MNTVKSLENIPAAHLGKSFIVSWFVDFIYHFIANIEIWHIRNSDVKILLAQLRTQLAIYVTSNDFTWIYTLRKQYILIHNKRWACVHLGEMGCKYRYLYLRWSPGKKQPPTAWCIHECCEYIGICQYIYVSVIHQSLIFQAMALLPQSDA